MKIIKTVDLEDVSVRLDKWFHRYYPNLSFIKIAKFLRKGFIRVNGKRHIVSYRLLAGDVISFPNFLLAESFDDANYNNAQEDRIFTKEQKRLAKNLKDTSIYEDENIIIINKPSDIATQGGSKINISIDDLSELLKDHPNAQKPRLVHRLDKQTSGALILAKSAKAACDIAELIRERAIEKKYVAILCGVPEKHNGIIDTPIIRKNYDQNYDNENSSDFLEALTEYSVISVSSDAKYAVVLFNLYTGRMHQLRIHSASIGHPIFGDTKYNKLYPSLVDEALLENSKQSKYLYLHSHQIKFNLYDKIITGYAKPPHHFISKCVELGFAQSISEIHDLFSNLCNP